VTRLRISQWIVMETDADGGGSQLYQFDTHRRAVVLIKIWRKHRPGHCYSAPTRVSVLLPKMARSKP